MTLVLDWKVLSARPGSAFRQAVRRSSILGSESMSGFGNNTLILPLASQRSHSRDWRRCSFFLQRRQSRNEAGCSG